MTTLRAVGILLGLTLLTLALLPFQWAAVRLSLSARRTIPRAYHRLVCRIMGLRIAVTGTPLTGGVLLAANHTGWLDIPVLSAILPVSFISKEEVGQWPVFGLLSRLQETLFISRERANTLKDRDAIRKRLIDGDAVVIFPEGTSSDGNRVLPFRSALLSAAELVLSEVTGQPVVHAKVQPVSVAHVALHGMPMGRENRPFFAWYGDMELVPHLWECLKTGPIDVAVEFHAPLSVDASGGRKALAAACEAAVRAGLTRALAGSRVVKRAAPRDGDVIEELSQTEAETEEAA